MDEGEKRSELSPDRAVPANASARALWYIGPDHAELRSEILRSPGPDEARVRMLWSGISRGTERLVAAGRVPASEALRMRAPWQTGDFPFPVKYGYCAVGFVEAGPAEWLDRHVFALHPHQDRFVLPISALQLLPAGLPPRRAILAANMETALNALWDSACGPGDRIAVVGAGVVGSLLAFLGTGLPGTEVIVIDRDPARRFFVEKLGARFVPVDSIGELEPFEADVVFHASASEAGLATALALAGKEAAIVELSWYGDRTPRVPLGGAFHSRRLRLLASQVGEIAAGRRPRWTHARRLAKALDLLADRRLDVLVTEEISFHDLAAALPRLFAEAASGVVTAVRYDENRGEADVRRRGA